MALYDDLLGTSADLSKYFAKQAGQSTGLAPEVSAALRTQALETIPRDFDNLSSSMATSLLRRGGGLPAGGDFLRGYAPIQTAKIRAKSDLLRDVLLADQAERTRTLDKNNENALATMGQTGSLGTALSGQAQAQNQYASTLAEQQRQFGLNQAFEGNQAELNRANQIKLAELNNAPASLKSLLTSSLLSSAFAPNAGLGGDSLAGKGIGALLDVFGGGGGGDSTGDFVRNQIPGAVGAIGSIGDGSGIPSGVEGPPLSGPSGGGISGALNSIGTLGGLVPLAAGIPLVGGAVAAGAYLLPKLFGQGRKQADKLTGEGGLQYNFNQGLADIVQLEQSGQINHEQRLQLVRDAFAQLATDASGFARQGSNQAKVVKQMIEHYMTNPVTSEALAPLRGQYT